MSSRSDRADGFEAGQKATSRPAGITDAHLTFLDNLRESGATNMFGAVPYLKRKFRSLSDGQAAAVLSYWMNSFGKPDR